MKNIIFYSLLVVLVGEIITLYMMNTPQTPKVLAETIEATPAPTVLPTPTPTSSPIPSITPTPKPTTPTPVPLPQFSSEQINAFIERFATQYGVSPHVLRHIALCESGFNPSAYHAGYAGLFQFGTATWKNLRSKMGEDKDAQLRFNAEESVQTTAYALSMGKSSLWPNCK